MGANFLGQLRTPTDRPSLRMRFQQDFCDVAITDEHASADWKSCVGKLTVGSNPTLSARSGQVTGIARVRAHGEQSPEPDV